MTAFSASAATVLLVVAAVVVALTASAADAATTTTIVGTATATTTTATSSYYASQQQQQQQQQRLTCSTTVPALFCIPRGGGGGGRILPSKNPKAFPTATLPTGNPSIQSNNNGTRSSISIRHQLRSLYTWWYKEVPSIARYFISGNLGNICFFCCERLISTALSVAVDVHQHHLLLPESLQELLIGPDYFRDSLSFFTAYMVHVPAQHYLHALLVYGLGSIGTYQLYWTTLGGTYSALTVSCVGSTALNAALLATHLGSRHKTAAFVATLWIFSLFNYVVLGWIARRSAASLQLSLSSPTTSSSSLRFSGKSNPSATIVSRGGGGGGRSNAAQCFAATTNNNNNHANANATTTEKKRYWPAVPTKTRGGSAFVHSSSSSSRE